MLPLLNSMSNSSLSNRQGQAHPSFPAARSVAGSCDVTATTVGDALTVICWVLQLVSWALAALFIAGLTGVVRRY